LVQNKSFKNQSALIKHPVLIGFVENEVVALLLC
jgi:hypothetical protein